MSSTELDADLYGDLYGADEFTGGSENEVKIKSTTPTEKTSMDAAEKVMPAPASSTSSKPSGNSPPPALPSTMKPTSHLQSPSSLKAAPPSREGTSSIPVFTDDSSGSSRNQPSYSSQVAQQFSSYSQTPDQERGGYAGGGNEGRSIRPSEMRDEG